MAAIYLDYNATTPLDPRVFEAMKEWYLGPPANAGSRTHIYGQRAKDAIEKARAQVGAVMGAKPEEIIFTSGATESNNIAILGLAAHGEATGRKHVLSTSVEHKAVLEPLGRLSELGFEVELTPVSGGGYVEPDAVKKRIRADTLLVSVMHANNETGVLQPIQEIGELLANTQVLFHTDAAQTFGKEETLENVSFDFASISGHKIYGPQGAGALCIRKNKYRRAPLMPLMPLMHGGGQEKKLRPGTAPVALLVGLGAAAELAYREKGERNSAAAALKEQTLSALSAVAHQINGDIARSQPHVLNLSFPGIDGEALMMALREDIAMSNGSACTSASYNPSHVLSAMAIDEERIAGSVRLSWGPGVDSIPCAEVVAAVKSMSINL